MDTSTVSFCVVGSTSDTTAAMVANGPSVTVTWSPTTYETSTVRFLAAAGLSPAFFSASEAIIGAIIATTSLRLSGAGSLVGPTKPVTPSVSRTMRRASSSGHMRISTYPGTRTRVMTFLPLSVCFSTSSIGTSTWKILSSSPKLATRDSTLVFTRFS